MQLLFLTEIDCICVSYMKSNQWKQGYQHASVSKTNQNKVHNPNRKTNWWKSRYVNISKNETSGWKISDLLIVSINLSMMFFHFCCSPFTTKNFETHMPNLKSKWSNIRHQIINISGNKVMKISVLAKRMNSKLAPTLTLWLSFPIWQLNLLIHAKQQEMEGKLETCHLAIILFLVTKYSIHRPYLLVITRCW